MQLLIVDDDSFTLKMLDRILAQFGHTTVRANGAQEALDILRQGNIRAVVTDWEMPGMSGLDLCRAIRNEDFNGYVYVIMLTGREGSESRRDGLRAGADDFLVKPLDPEELLTCLTTAERILALETHDLTLFALAKLAESRDPDTGGHLERVQSYARLLARNLPPQVVQASGVDAEYIRLLYQTSPLHDLGKVGIPDSVLLKPGKLTREEFEIMKTHCSLGAQTLDAALQRFPNIRFLQMARDIAATHHEKFDGSGYPSALAGEQIPLCGRIVALADVYDALTSRRSYKSALSHEEARRLILAERGRHFDPGIVDAFLKVESQFASLRLRMGDEAIAEGPQSSQATGTAPIPPAAATAPTPLCNILVVEDSPVTLGKLVNLLGATHCPVFPAANATEALAQFNAHQPGVVVSDWEMPGDSGLELCRRIRAENPKRHIHFIMLTIHSDDASLLEAYNAGVDDFVAKPYNPQELLARVGVGLRTVHLQEELQRKTRTQQVLNTQLEAVNRRLDHLSITDDLTGLFNRRHAMVRLQEHWALAERHGQPLCVAMVDIDHFKKVNDTFGHDAGDVVLHQVADILRCSTRSTDLTCRMGGEEFLILFPLQSVNDATACAERCRAAVAEHVFRVGSAEIRATISIGVAGVTTAMTHFPELLRAADRMLYFAKTNGRNRVQSAPPITDGGAAPQPLSLAPDADPNAAASATFDPNSILARCGGDSDFAAAVAEKFCKQAPSEMTRLEESLTTNNTEAFRRAARNVKSMATVVSARAALDLAARLERIARSGQLADAPPLVHHLQQEIDSVVISITAVGNQSRQKCA